ncbi:MAG: FAD-dependent 5-carboxymethylaminomethyl-2-thiouridine(34) oxidoreductase MnmC, partial [Comamonas sp.]
GRVLLTLWIGDVHTQLRQQHSTADALLLHADFAAQADAYTFKALAKHCQRGSYVVAPSLDDAVRQGLHSAGFVPAANADDTQWIYAPRWQPKLRDMGFTPFAQADTALVVGAGLAGAAIAHSLALRGWQVTVLCQGEHVADGASGLPAGLFCPHVSPDDSVLSRLSRSGVRMTLQRLQQLCEPGVDWAHTGVLEHGDEADTGLPASWQHGPGTQWSAHAIQEQLAAAHLPANAKALWHTQAGWVRPARLVQAQLQHPNITVRTQAQVVQLQQQDTQWQAVDAQGQVLAQAQLAVLAAGPTTPQLWQAAQGWRLQAIRGQITWAVHNASSAMALPPFPVNGNGNLVPHVPAPEGPLWVMGSTFERDVYTLPVPAHEQAAAHAVNLDKLRHLLPATAAVLAPYFDPHDASSQPTWAQVRLASHDRLPIAGPLGDSQSQPPLWALTALGARGLTLSILCAELIAAKLHGEPLPLDAKLAQHVGTERL